MQFTGVGIVLIVGVVQGFLSSGLIQLSNVRNQQHNKILTLLLLCLSITLLPTLFGQVGLVTKAPFLHFIPLDLSLFVLPLLYFYFHSVFNKSISKRGIKLHLIIPILFHVYYLAVWLLTIRESEKSFIANELFYFQVQSAAQLVRLYMVLYYSYLSLRVLRLGKLNRSSKSQAKFIPWLKFLISLLMLLSVLEISALAIGKYYGYWQGSPIDEWLGTSFMMLVKMMYAVVIYFIAYLGYAKYRTLSFSVPKLPSAEIDSYLRKIKSAMEMDRKYLDPNLKLADLASMLDTSQVYVSSLLNKELNLSFNDFVNSYRVKEVQAKLRTEAVDKYTLLSLAKDSGFKSKTTFYRAFQKFTNQSPTAYLQQLNQN